jgi:tetratricopeptide (TPR) repeat protein
MLEQGVARSRHGEQVPGFNVLAAELTLAQMYNSRLEYDKALALLTRPQTGPLALIAAENPVALRGNYAGEALTAALRSYVGARRIDQAEQVMNQLEKQYANSPDGDAQLTAIYVRLGRELETELKQLQAASKHDHLQQVLDGFQLFLDRIAARDVANAATLLWVGETYYRLATGIQDDPAKSAQAKGYFERSKNAYEKLLQQSESDPKLQQGAAAIRVRLARAYRGARDYRAALDQLTKILSESPNVLECQIEAAHTYADWGRVDPQWYQQAINGTGDDGRIWGFNGIRRRLQNVERFKSQYEEARFQVANCSYQLALSKQGDERINSLNTVERMIQSFARLDPELGGSQWREKYDRLLKDVQRAAGRQPQGLPNITSATTARSRTTPAT